MAGFVVLAVLVALFLPRLAAQDTASSSLHGGVRDTQGKPLRGVMIRLALQDSAQSQATQSDSEGNYSFTALHGGVYVLTAEMTGYSPTEIRSVFLAASESKTLDFLLLPPKTASAAASGQAPQFFDEPTFAVAGVTDTTSLGGHGPDTIVRTRESLAKETVSLGKGGHAEPAPSTDESLLRDQLERNPGSFEANHLLGETLDAKGKARDAIPYLERAGELKPDDYSNSYALALANTHAGNYEQARAQSQALLLHHDSAELHHLVADIDENLGNSLQAVREYERAAGLDPREPYLFDWGADLLLHHAPEPAIQVFTRGNRLFPHSSRMLIGLGAAWFARGSYDQAVQRICQASDLNPGDSAAYLFLGKMLRAESSPSHEAIEKLHRFVTLQPENAEANYYYAVALWKSNKRSPDAARAGQIESLLHKAIQINPDFAAAYLQLGILDAERKNYASAISEDQRAIQADPQLEEAHYRLAQAYRQTGDTAKADAELKLYDQIAKASAQQAERERHEIQQFVYTLRDQPH